jgi:hypothetical protein
MSGNDAACQQAATQLRAEHPAWLVIWVARTQQFRAWPLAASRAGAGLADAEPGGLAAQISQAEQAAAGRRRRPRRAPIASPRSSA